MTRDLPDRVLRAVLSVVPPPRPPAEPVCPCATCREARDQEKNRWDWRALDDARRQATQLRGAQR